MISVFLHAISLFLHKISQFLHDLTILTHNFTILTHDLTILTRTILTHWLFLHSSFELFLHDNYSYILVRTILTQYYSTRRAKRAREKWSLFLFFQKWILFLHGHWLKEGGLTAAGCREKIFFPDFCIFAITFLIFNIFWWDFFFEIRSHYETLKSEVF